MASASDVLKLMTRKMTPTNSNALTEGKKICPVFVSEVKRISMRGRKPRLMPWRTSEKAPVMTAWLAMMVAAVARMTAGSSAHCGKARKNGSDTAAGLPSTRAPCPR